MNGVKGKIKINELFGTASIEFREGMRPVCRYTVKFDLNTGQIKINEIEQDAGCFAYEKQIKDEAVKQLLINLKDKLNKMN